MTEQGSDAWKLERLGKATASRVADLIAKTKTGWGASRANYAAQLIAERLTGVPQETYSNAAMQWGTATEPEAVAAYEFYRDVMVERVGFVPHPRIDMAGCSPDGLVGNDGLVECKCPLTKTHIETLLSGKVPPDYTPQIQFQMACTGRAWCDFVSFDPRMPEEMRLFIGRVERDDKYIAELEQMVGDFLAEVAAKTNTLTKKFAQKEAA
jgi:putative phage-type endonuclease